jgi:16S rRNA (adenine1518-N6/adenine1519-N6)-dimethyltransferase
LQKEVVDRMVAAAGDSEFGRLSVMLQYRFDIQSLFDVPPESFDPPPKVQSSIVRLVPRPVDQLGLCDETVFARLVTAAFAQRRKMLRNTLKGLVSDAEFAAVGIEPTWRAEDVPVDAYVALANLKLSG